MSGSTTTPSIIETSQYWANHYLAELDHFVKDERGLRAYVRYMDDMVFFSREKSKLLELRRDVAAFLSDRLALSLKIASVGPLTQGLSFLGFTVKPTGIYLAKRSRDRFRKKMRAISDGLEAAEITEIEAQCRSQSLVAFTLIARARRFRNSVLSCLQGLSP
jgi:RNA-directed DNA polymerase